MIIVGTAGHIDHGKTTLATTLTGVATDRLKEEQSRGISIELGFAHLDLPNGQKCGLIDVPGHEKFVRQMIAGAMGVDLVLVVIAADEGIMPQTREHLDICRLLGIQRGVVVLTKVDLVDEEWLELVEEDIREFTEGSFLEGQPIWHFSPHDPELVSQVKTSLNDWVTDFIATRKEPDLSRPFKLSMDRVFSMKGFGTVVTGTVTSGVLRASDTLESVHGEKQSKVRGIQVHGEAREEAPVGSRAAVNLQGVEKGELRRGDVLIRKDELLPTSMLDAKISIVSSMEKPLSQRSKALVHLGTTQLAGTVVLMGTTQANAGDDVLVQIRLEQPTVVLPGERLVLRGFEVLANYGKTFAGGKVLDPLPVKHKSMDMDVLQSLEKMGEGTLGDVLEEVIRLSGEMEVDFLSIWRRVDGSKRLLQETLGTLTQSGVLCQVGSGQETWMHQVPMEGLEGRMETLLQDFHNDHPSRVGMPKEELRSRLRYGMSQDVLDSILSRMSASNRVFAEKETVALKGFSPVIRGRIAQVCEELFRMYERRGLQPPTQVECADEISSTHQEVREAADVLVREGRLIHVKGALYFSKKSVDSLQEELVRFLRANPEISTTEFKEMTRVSRKYTIPLAEYFDAQKVTLRAGDAGRRLRTK